MGFNSNLLVQAFDIALLCRMDYLLDHYLDLFFLTNYLFTWVRRCALTR